MDLCIQYLSLLLFHLKHSFIWNVSWLGMVMMVVVRRVIFGFGVSSKPTAADSALIGDERKVFNKVRRAIV